MGGKLTIKQIADMAGVSVAAVSYTLNGKKGVGEATRKRILDTIENTNYTPNVNSRRLILQRSFNILLVIDADNSPLDNLFYMEIMSSIVDNGAKYGYNVVLVKLTETFEESGLKNTLLQHNADGIIFLCDISPDFQKSINKIGTPFVVIDSQRTNPPYPSIRADYNIASQCATKYLVENGHTKIAMLGSDNIPEYYMCTFEGYKNVLEEHGIDVKSEWIQSNANNDVAIKNCVQKLLDSDGVPTAIFCSSDFIAVNAMSYLQTLGYILPDDFSVCSIDDITLSRYHFPSLTTVRIDKEAMGKLAVDVLSELINGEETKINVTVPSCELVIRNSVKKIRNI